MELTREPGRQYDNRLVMGDQSGNRGFRPTRSEQGLGSGEDVFERLRLNHPVSPTLELVTTRPLETLLHPAR